MQALGAWWRSKHVIGLGEFGAKSSNVGAWRLVAEQCWERMTQCAVMSFVALFGFTLWEHMTQCTVIGIKNVSMK